jgi:two-component system, sensor histidine kinase LadS
MAFMLLLSHFVQNLTLFSRVSMQQIKRLALLICALMLSAAPAQAQLASVPSAGLELTRLEVLHNVPVGLTLAQVHTGQAGEFVPHNSLQISHPVWDRALWLRLYLKASPAQAQPWHSAVLMLPTPYLDSVRLYTPGARAGEPWSVQQSGDFFAPHTWAMRSLYPKLNAPSPGDAAWQGGNELVLYIQVDHLAPVLLRLEMADAKQALDRDLLSLVIYSVGLGAILLAAMLTAAMAWLHRDVIYAWYSAYAVCGALACASHSGLAQNLLWPIGGYWPGTAILCFVLLCAFCQLQFSLALNTDQFGNHPLRFWVYALSAACIAVAIGFPIFTGYWQAFYFATLPILGSAMALSILLMIMGMRAGHRLARVWLWAFIPLFGSIFLGLLEGVGLLPSSYWSYSLAIYAAIAEMLVLGLALQWFARERHGELERLKTLATVDPLTGFVTAQAFQSQLLHDWQSHKNQNRHLAVAYIQLQTRAQNDQQMQQMLTRCVRVLRSASGVHDVVARLDGQLLALLMHDVPMGDALNQRLSRIVALGLMPDTSQPQVSILQFRIAATTRERYAKPLTQLDEDLRTLLAQPKGWGSKPIRYIDRANSHQTSAIDLDSQQLDQFWDRALGDQIAGETAKPAGATTARSPRQ